MSCRDSVTLVKVANFEVKPTMLEGEIKLYENSELGFTTSDPTNCPLGVDSNGAATGFTATFVFNPTGTVETSLGGVWTTDTNKLKVLRFPSTTLNQVYSIKVTATDANSNALENTISLTILGCEQGNWKCE